MNFQASPRPEKTVQHTDSLDLREFGAKINGVPQISTRRLFLQLQVFSGCAYPEKLIEPIKSSLSSLCKGGDLEVVLYQDLNDPDGIGLLFITEDVAHLTTEVRSLLSSEPFAALRRKPGLTMIGRTYASGNEPNLEDWLLVKPRRNALNPEFPWAIWYPLRRKSEFYLLPEPDRRKVLLEHAMIGRAYAQAGYAYDIRLACFGLDENDNEFVIGLVGPELYPLSRLIQEMRHTQQTGAYIESLGPFFVGKVCWQSPLKI